MLSQSTNALSVSPSIPQIPLPRYGKKDAVLLADNRPAREFGDTRANHPGVDERVLATETLRRATPTFVDCTEPAARRIICLKFGGHESGSASRLLVALCSKQDVRATTPWTVGP